jgi:hypothetical protein
VSEGVKKLQREAAARERRILAQLEREQRRRAVADRPEPGSDRSEGGGDAPDPQLGRSTHPPETFGAVQLAGRDAPVPAGKTSIRLELSAPRGIP